MRNEKCGRNDESIDTGPAGEMADTLSRAYLEASKTAEAEGRTDEADWLRTMSVYFGGIRRQVN